MGIEKFTEDEVRTAVKLGAQHNSISEREKELIENVLAFNDKTVGQVMTPKDRAVYFPADMKAAEAHEKAIKGTYSRFPVLREGKVVGTVSMRALGRAVLDNPNWRVGHVMWAPIKVKSSDKLNHAFSKLQTLGRHIAVVEGDHGEYLGLITIEDLMDELVGEHK
jgi:CBS domain containing-hemolysin-like protein